MALQPWGGNHANLLHCLRPQRANQFTGGDYPGLREALLPVLGRAVWTHMGIRTDFQALIAAPGTTPRHTPTGENQKLAGGAAARTVPAGRLLATRLTTGPGSQPPRQIQASPFPCPQWASLNIDLESCIGMPAPQAYKPPTQSHLILTISARRNPRSGRLSDKKRSQKSCRPRRTIPACADREFSNSPRRAQLPLLVGWISGTGVTDIQCGCRALPCRCAGA